MFVRHSGFRLATRRTVYYNACMKSDLPYQDTREHLLAVAEELICGRGFAACGLAEILQKAQVPKGSFYHYFASKEAFGVALLQRYFDRYVDELQGQLLAADATLGRQRLIAYFSAWVERMRERACMQGCFAVKLSAEVADLSEPMRATLVQGMARIEAVLAQALAQLQPPLAGQDARACAADLYTHWCGADLQAKVRRSPEPLEAALRWTERRLLLELMPVMES